MRLAARSEDRSATRFHPRVRGGDRRQAEDVGRGSSARAEATLLSALTFRWRFGSSARTRRRRDGASGLGAQGRFIRAHAEARLRCTASRTVARRRIHPRARRRLRRVWVVPVGVRFIRAHAEATGSRRTTLCRPPVHPRTRRRPERGSHERTGLRFRRFQAPTGCPAVRVHPRVRGSDVDSALHKTSELRFIRACGEATLRKCSAFVFFGPSKCLKPSSTGFRATADFCAEPRRRCGGHRGRVAVRFIRACGGDGPQSSS